jgi:hypothetical protein
MPRTLAQEWAQKRNWLKARITSAKIHPTTETLTHHEIMILNRVNKEIDIILAQWRYRNAESKKAYIERHII